jgi:hypothetical protein
MVRGYLTNPKQPDNSDERSKIQMISRIKAYVASEKQTLQGCFGKDAAGHGYNGIQDYVFGLR